MPRTTRVGVCVVCCVVCVCVVCVFVVVVVVVVVCVVCYARSNLSLLCLACSMTADFTVLHYAGLNNLTSILAVCIDTFSMEPNIRDLWCVYRISAAPHWCPCTVAEGIVCDWSCFGGALLTRNFSRFDCVCVCVPAHASLCVAHRHTGTQKHTQTHRHTQTHAPTHTDTDTDTDTHTFTQTHIHTFTHTLALSCAVGF